VNKVTAAVNYPINDIELNFTAYSHS